MKRIKICLLACVTAFLLFAILVVSPAMVGASQQSVELIQFELRSISSGVEIRWETATESDIAYFKVKRGPAPAGPYQDLAGIGLIEAMGSPVSGHAYTAVDRTATQGQAYSYQLVELTLTNQENVVAEDDITLAPPQTGEPIGSLPPSPTPSPTGSGQDTATLQPTAAATTGGATPGSTAPAGNATAAPTAAVTTTVVASPTRAANTLGPTPTRFSFTPRPPTVATTGSPSGLPDVQANAPSALAQATIDPYPGPGGVQPTDPGQTAPGALPTTQVLTTAVGAPDMQPNSPAAYPGATLDGSAGLPASVGAGVGGPANEGTQMEAEAAQETTSTARLLLWLGFLAAFFIFIGGIGFSIVLSTRRRENDLP